MGRCTPGRAKGHRTQPFLSWT
ncbi:hypothetical protein AZE42_07145 [Rhizopogon vesiculosus]|uniref:Uncharacterized protein n=1 Tax=Rhizopogon vesiculosus TaxID=180088 RepID=A0A1J8Q743_9AGAM|nr:hypothetical protein AZE42_07145 [Rhizopogon vesiculosus]